MEDSNPQHGIKKAIQLPLHALTLTLLVAGLTCAATGAGKGIPFQLKPDPVAIVDCGKKQR